MNFNPDIHDGRAAMIGAIAVCLVVLVVKGVIEPKFVETLTYMVMGYLFAQGTKEPAQK